MNRFDDLWADALRRLAAGSGGAPGTTDLSADLLTPLGRLTFPGRLALLGLGVSSAQDVPHRPWTSVIEAVSRNPSVGSQGIEGDTVSRVLGDLFVRRRSLDDTQLRREVVEVLLKVTAEEVSRRSPVQLSEARAIGRLLATGQVFRDLAGTTAAVVSVVPGIPIAFVTDLPRTPGRIARLALALAQDLGQAAHGIPHIVEDLLDGSLDQPPGVLTHTLEWLYDFATLSNIVITIRALIAPENQSFRLALLIFARANGVPLEETDLNVLRDSVFNSERPDLGPALSIGIQKLRARYGVEDLGKLLRRLEV